MSGRWIHVAVAALVSMAPVLSLAQVSSLDAAEGWSAIADCATREGERARHACIDAVLRHAGLLTPQAEAKQRRQQFGLEGEAPRPPPPSADRAPSAPPPAPSPAPPAEPRQPAPAPERLEFEVASAVESPDRKLVLTTGDGAVWKQVDSDRIPQRPRKGERVSIRKATLGSYLCTLPSRHTFRCQRTR